MNEASDPNTSEFESADLDGSPFDPLLSLPRQFIIAIGGGKGGVGKSLLAANLGIYLAQTGRQTVLVDLDLGGANLHTFVGVDRPRITLGDLFCKRVSNIKDCIVDTPTKGLGLISAEGDPLWVADPRATTKRRLLQGIQEIDADVVICDLPAGSGFMALDFFSIAQMGILLVVPEPTSAENAYRFIKSAFLRRLRMNKGLEDSKLPLGSVMEQLDFSSGDKSEGGIPSPRDIYESLELKDPEQARIVAAEMLAFRPHLVINQTRSRADILLGEHMQMAGRRRLGLPIESLGHIDSDDAVWNAVRRRKPLLTEYPESRAAKQIDQLARHILSEGKKPNLPSLKRLSEQTLYEVLDVNPGDSAEEIRRSVRLMRELYAPQSMVINGLYSTERLAQLHQRINEAYDTLLENETRKRYDLSIFPEGRPPQQIDPSKHAQKRPSLDAEHLLENPTPPISISPQTEFSGQLLQSIRVSLGISLSDIAEQTKVGVHQLELIEAEAWKDLPAPVYLRGFLAAYATYLHLDKHQVITTYLAKIPKPKTS